MRAVFNPTNGREHCTSPARSRDRILLDHRPHIIANVERGPPLLQRPDHFEVARSGREHNSGAALLCHMARQPW